jgi:hypothetical protein
MPIGKYLERRDVQVGASAGFLILLLVLVQYGPFLAYGIPAITFHTITQTKPVSKSITILNSYGAWVAYDYSFQGSADWGGLGWGRHLKATLSASIGIKVEVTDLILSGFLTEIKPPPFLVNETESEILFKNMTVQAYAYGFKLTTAWSGSASISVDSYRSDGFPPPTAPDQYWAMKNLAQTVLIPDFNKNYLVAADPILMSLDAPTLATDKAYELRPDYLGIAGMWLSDYQMKGYTTGTAAEMLPQSTGTAVKLFRDSDLTQPCWAADYSDSKPLLTPDVVYWLDHFAPSSGWWSISIVNIGSQLVYDDTKAYPNYVSWAWEKYGKDSPIQAPSVAQWFRVDLVFRTTKDWTVPRIPQYELPQAEKEKMKIIVTVEPQNQGTPLTQPSVIAAFPWTQIYWLLLIFFGGLVAVITVYYIVKKKGKVKT